MLVSTKCSKCTLVPPTERVGVGGRYNSSMVQFYYVKPAWTSVLCNYPRNSILFRGNFHKSYFKVTRIVI